jgi:hypothetical protein
MRKKITIEVDSDSDNEFLEEKFWDVVRYGFSQGVWKTATIKVEDIK